jgi:hypothetical protein
MVMSLTPTLQALVPKHEDLPTVRLSVSLQALGPRQDPALVVRVAPFSQALLPTQEFSPRFTVADSQALLPTQESFSTVPARGFLAGIGEKAGVLSNTGARCNTQASIGVKARTNPDKDIRGQSSTALS